MSAMWEWQDASWHRLNSKDAGALEAAYLQDPLGCCPVALGPNESCYEVDFASMKQRSRGSGRVRNLRRKAPLQEVVLQVHAQASADWQEELHEVLNRAEALAEEAKVCSEIEPPVAEALPSVDFGSLQSLQRSLDLGRVVLLRGAWLVCHTDCLQSVPTFLPAEALWEGPLVAAPAPAPLVLSLGTNVLDAGELQVLAELVSNQASQGIFLDCCSLADPSEGQRDLCEWFASPFTTKCFARSAAVDDASISRCGLRCFQQQLGCLGAGAEVYEVLGLNSESAESVPALQEVAPSVQVTPEAFDIMMKSMDFQRAEDLEIFKELYREAFSSLVGAREWMDCSGLAWEDFQMIQLAEVLVHSKSLVKLVLAENHVGDLGLETLAPCLPETLELLDLSRNYIEHQGLECLAQYLPHRLRQLCLSYNPFGARGMEGLVRSLPKCSQLHSLRLAGISGIASVELDFAPLTALRHLCLNEVQLGQEGLVHLSLPDALEDLQLDNNQLCDLSPLVLRLPPSLRTLALSENELSDQGLVSLNLSLHCFRSLQTLRVNFNHISTQVLGELQQKAPQLQIFAAHQQC